jgi:hypothetical protein
VSAEAELRRREQTLHGRIDDLAAATARLEAREATVRAREEAVEERDARLDDAERDLLRRHRLLHTL